MVDGSITEANGEPPQKVIRSMVVMVDRRVTEANDEAFMKYTITNDSAGV